MTGGRHNPESTRTRPKAGGNQRPCDICGCAATYTDVLDTGAGSTPLPRAYCELHAPPGRPRRAGRPRKH